MSCIYKLLFSDWVIFWTKTVQKMLAIHENECYNFDIFKDNFEYFSNSNSSSCGMFHNSKRSSKLVWNYQNVFTLLGEALKSKNGLHFWHHFLFKIKFYGLHGHWKVWIRKINFIFQHNSIYQWRIGLCTYSSSYPFFRI